MKLIKTTGILAVLLLLVNLSDAQVKFGSKKWRSPFITIDCIGSFNLPIQEARGRVGDFFSFKNYGTSVGFGAQFNIKFGLGPKGHFRPYITLGYSQLQGSDNSTAWIDSNWIRSGYPLPGSLLYNSIAGTSRIILRNPFIGAGFEVAFVEVEKKKRQFIPFIGVEFLMNFITGMYRQKPTETKGPAPNIETAHTIKLDFRMGIGAGLGANIRFTSGFGIVFGAKYKFANLIGKTSDFLFEENKMNLLDQANISLNTNLSKARNIGFIEFYLGVSFFAGKTKK